MKNDCYEKCVGSTRAPWLRGVIEKIKNESRILILGNRRSGKSTILRDIAKIKNIKQNNVFLASAFNSETNMIDRFEIFCKAPQHTELRVVLIDDIECFSSADLKIIRRCIRLFTKLCFILTTSTISGLNESIVSQCNIVQLNSPTKEDIRSIVGNDIQFEAGVSIGAAFSQAKATKMIGLGENIDWHVRCHLPSIIHASKSGAAEDLDAAIAETTQLLKNGWSCGDIIETLHNKLTDQCWPTEQELAVATVLLKYATLGEKADTPSILVYMLVIELAATFKG